ANSRRTQWPWQSTKIPCHAMYSCTAGTGKPANDVALHISDDNAGCITPRIAGRQTVGQRRSIRRIVRDVDLVSGPLLRELLRILVPGGGLEEIRSLAHRA